MRPLLVIAGPTAAGKSALATDLAERRDGEIVSADALQVYRGLDIGTAKPEPVERRRVPHHLIDILDPDQPYSAGEFVRLARQAIDGIRKRGRQPFVVGGSGLYLRALTEGLVELPEVSGAIRARLRARLDTEGLGSLRRELERRDAVTARRLDPNDTQRTLRALEILEATGQPFSRWLADGPAAPAEPSRILALTLPRRLLYDRIADRVDRMMDRGWLDEVAGLLQAGVSRQSPAFQAIGYRQLAAVVAGERPLEEAIQEIVRDTRRYAKRQLTWFRHQADVHWIQAVEPGQRLELAVEWMRSVSP